MANTNTPHPNDTEDSQNSDQSRQSVIATVNSGILPSSRNGIPARVAETATNRSHSTNSGGQTQSVMDNSISKQNARMNTLDGSAENDSIDDSQLLRKGLKAPSWPTSPRLKSPPPNSLRNPNNRRESSEQMFTNVSKRLATTSDPDISATTVTSENSNLGSKSPMQPASNIRVPVRSAIQASNLATVSENSVPTTSFEGPITSASKSEEVASAKKENRNVSPEASTYETTKSEASSRAPSTSRPSSGTNLTRRSFTNLTLNKKVVPNEQLRTMTVETEPVTNLMPILDRNRNRDGGSIRTKPSNETIKPKKEKKRPQRKPPSLHGPGTSKADIFEAKVANAVDEADTDDSDETFVYESNPPESASYRYHSRTPSSTSMTSTTDQYKHNKSRHSSVVVAPKKSMKFSNSHRDHGDTDDSRYGSRTTTTTRPHHIGRHGRPQHPSLFDGESPFTRAQNTVDQRTPTHTKSYHLSNPNSPRYSTDGFQSPRKYGGHAYDNNEDVADDERAPLMGSVRRNRHSKRPGSREFRSAEMGEDSDPASLWHRCKGCTSLLIMMALFSIILVAFIVTINKPLFDVQIRKIEHVLVSEQELMLDLDVKATNPNLFAITVQELDVNIFAESSYAGTDGQWYRDNPGLPIEVTSSSKKSQVKRTSWWWPPYRKDNGVDEGTDPDDESGISKLLLGGVYEFDTALIFDPDPIKRNSQYSTGAVRLAKPANKTEAGGSTRWEHVLQHDFDLIVRGVIKYQLPLSSRVRSAKIAGRKTVHPDAEDDDGDDAKKNITKPVVLRKLRIGRKMDW